jgi:hypothetical protein
MPNKICVIRLNPKLTDKGIRVKHLNHLNLKTSLFFVYLYTNGKN